MRVKSIIILLALFLYNESDFAQQTYSVSTNINAGLWNNAAVWMTNKIPDSTVDVILSNNISVNVNAVCHSLTTNGYTVTVNTGKKLLITGNTSSTTIDDDTLLTKITGSAPDTANDNFYITFGYDASKRLIEKNFITTYDTTLDTYFYNGSATLPYKVTSIYTDGDTLEMQNDTSYFNYNASGIIIKDSLITSSPFEPYDSSTQTDTYIINTNSVTQIESDFIVDTIINYQTKQNGLVISQSDTTIGNEINDYNFTYDSAINPLYKLSLHYPVYPQEEYDLFDDPQQKNNLVYKKQIFGGFEYGFTAGFLYKTNHLPLAAVFNKLEDTTAIGTLQYYYSK